MQGDWLRMASPRDWSWKDRVNTTWVRKGLFCKMQTILHFKVISCYSDKATVHVKILTLLCKTLWEPVCTRSTVISTTKVIKSVILGLAASICNLRFQIYQVFVHIYLMSILMRREGNMWIARTIGSWLKWAEVVKFRWRGEVGSGAMPLKVAS